VTQKKLRRISQAIDDCSLGIVIDGFVWPLGVDPSQYDRPRGLTPPASPRKIEEIPTEEVMAAVRRVLQHNHALEFDELVRASAKLLGITRAGNRVSERVAEAIDRVVQSGVAVRHGTRVALGD